jgi:hypothetical protein
VLPVPAFWGSAGTGQRAPVRIGGQVGKREMGEIARAAAGGAAVT